LESWVGSADCGSRQPLWASNVHLDGRTADADLRKYWDEEQVVEIVGVIATFGFLNRWNDTLATPLEDEPIAVGEKFLAPHGWSPGKHAA